MSSCTGFKSCIHFIELLEVLSVSVSEKKQQHSKNNKAGKDVPSISSSTYILNPFLVYSLSSFFSLLADDNAL